MRIQFDRPAPGWAYSQNDIADVPEHRAKFLIANGYAHLVEQPVKHFSQLMVEKAIKKGGEV